MDENPECQGHEIYQGPDSEPMIEFASLCPECYAKGLAIGHKNNEFREDLWFRERDRLQASRDAWKRLAKALELEIADGGGYGSDSAVAVAKAEATLREMGEM